MNRITFNMINFHQHGPAFRDFLSLRKRFFVDELQWDIPHDASVEMDQYDNPTAWYSLVYYGDELVGGARVMSTAANWGSHTYMLGDALEGKLDDIPDSIMNSDISSNSVWEVTRLVISDKLTTQVERSACLRQILNGIVDIAAKEGAQELISLSPVAMVRALRQIGFDVRRDGEPYLNDDGRRYAMLRMPAKLSSQTDEFAPLEGVIGQKPRELVLS